MEEKPVEMSRVCSINFAVHHWFIVRKSIYLAMETGRLRVARIDDRWYIAVADLNKRYGNNAPVGAKYLYVQSHELQTLCDYAPKKRGRPVMVANMSNV